MLLEGSLRVCKRGQLQSGSSDSAPNWPNSNQLQFRSYVSHYAHTNVTCLMAALLVQAWCRISMVSRSGLARVQSAGGANVPLRPPRGRVLRILVKATLASLVFFDLA